MKRQFVRKMFAMIVTGIMAAALVTGCGSETALEGESAIETAIEETSVALSDGVEGTDGQVETAENEMVAPYFKKGVYVNYSAEAENPPKTYFYVFNTDGYGRTEDGANDGIGLPFDCTQAGGKVEFFFGGADEKQEVFIVTSVDKGVVNGYFEGAEDRELVFEPVADADPDTFMSVNYLSDGEYVYRDANGWSIKYDPNCFDITQDGPMVSIVYTGECAGTNMVLVTYDVEHNGKAARDERVQSWGEKATSQDSIFPGTEDVTGYWAMLPPEEDGSGIYMTSVSRDYMDGSLTFELTGHNSGDEMADMEVSDRMAMIIDSLQFDSAQ